MPLIEISPQLFVNPDTVHLVQRTQRGIQVVVPRQELDLPAPDGVTPDDFLKSTVDLLNGKAPAVVAKAPPIAAATPPAFPAPVASAPSPPELTEVTPKMAWEDWKSKFLASLVETGNVSASCRIAGVARQTAYVAKKDDPDFAEQWDDAIEEGVDSLEEVARRRAKSDSDTLLIFLLKAHRPKVYRDNLKLEHDGGVTVRVEYADHNHDYLTASTPGSVEDTSGGQAV